MDNLCTNCSSPLLLTPLAACAECGHYYPLTIAQRIEQITDPDSFVEMEEEMASVNPISLVGYEEKLEESQARSSLTDAVVIGSCTIEGRSALLGVMSFAFMGGSMGSVVGEKITQVILEGALHQVPVILVTASGGARMQEGIFSLMQMAKTASAAALLGQSRTPLFIVLTHPTTGGVTASFAMLGDVILAERGALIGFAGPRVIEGTIGGELPEGFQRAEFQKEKGFVDAIISREKLKETLSFLIRTHQLEEHDGA